MNMQDEDRVRELLKQVLPSMERAEPEHDLWPLMLRRMDTRPVAPPWFDWALVGGVVAFAFFIPAAIPVFLYYL